jgi:hypothetical protein
LQDLDPANIDPQLINGFYDDTTEWTYKLFEDTVLEKENENEVIVEEQATVASRNATVSNFNDCEFDDQELQLFSMMKKRLLTENVEAVNNQETLDRKRTELRIKIRNSMEEYRKQCKQIDMPAYLEANGNELYKTMKKNKQLDLQRINDFEDALYISKFFDVTKWWQDNDCKYPELSLAATIILGKPTHNAFQERVFSRGTYTDTKLRKRLKEEFFEMSVMNAINGTMINEMYELMQPMMDKKNDLEKENKKGKQEIQEYLDKREVEIDLTLVKDMSKLKMVDKEFGSITSQCTDDLSSVDGDDDDGSIDVMEYILEDEKEEIIDVDETDGKIRGV